MAKQTVDEFIIQMGFSETVMKGLAKLEKQLIPVANRMEKKLEKAFKVDAAKQAQPGINKLVRNVETAARHINKSLNNAFKIGNISTQNLKGLENESRATAKRIAKEIRNAYRQQLPPLPRPTPAGGAGGAAGRRRPGRTPEDIRSANASRIDDITHRQRTGAFYGNMQLRNPEQAAEYRQRLAGLRSQHISGNADVTQFRRGLRDLNMEFAQAQRAASMQARAAAEASGGLGGLVGEISPLIAGIMSVHKALQFFEDSLKVGAERTQAATMMQSAFSSNPVEITEAVNKVANQYGMNETEAQQQAARLRQTLPEQVFNDQEIVKFMENSSVFAHLTGASNDQVSRMQYGLQQVATTGTLSKQDWKQITENMPGIVKPLLELTHTKNATELFEYAKALKTGGERAKLAADAMDLANRRADAYQKAQHSIIAAQGRYQNAIEHDQNAFFKGYEEHFRGLLDSLSDSMNNSTGAFYVAGEALGWFFDRLTEIVNVLDTISMNVSGYLGLIKEEWNKFFGDLSPEAEQTLQVLKTKFNEFFDIFLVAASALAAKGLAGKLSGLLGVGGKAATAGEAAVAGTGILGLAGAISLASIAATSLGDALFDSVIPAFTKMMGWGGESGTETTHGGTTLAGSWDDWLFTKIGNAWDSMQDAPIFNGNWTGSTAPALPVPGSDMAGYGFGTQQLQLTQDPIQIAPITLNIPMPDGSTFTKQIDLQIQNAKESEYMLAGGLRGGNNWKAGGADAGFTPSLMNVSTKHSYRDY